MQRFSTVQYLLAAVLLLSACQKKPEHAFQQYSIEQFMNTTAITGSAFSPDEKEILFSSDASGVYNAYVVPATGGEPRRVTHSTTNAIFAISFFPNDRRILYRSDSGGNEIYHLYVCNEDSSTQDLTPDENARAVFYDWAYDQKSFFFGSNKRDPKFLDVYEMDIATLVPKLIYQNDAGYDFGGISNDKQYLTLAKTITTNNSEMYLFNLETDMLKHLTPHEGEIVYSPITFGVDNKNLYFLTNENSEFSYLMRYDLDADEFATVEKAPWDIMYAYFSRNGKYLVVGINNDAKTEIKIYDTGTDAPVQLPSLPDGEITAVNISDSETAMTFYHNGSRSPNDLYVYGFANKTYTRLTSAMNPEIDRRDLVDARVVRYKSGDGLEIPALYYPPQKKHVASTRAPALVWVHGGPGGQSRVGYNPLIQYLVNHGYAIIAVNNRGSSGYGKTFFKLDDMKHGENDLADCVAAKRFLAETGEVDESKIGIIGGSYGGYMVLAALAFQPEAFTVGVDLFGVANWVRTLESIPAWWEAFREALYTELGNPATDRTYLQRISPLFHADQITKPLMVLQGANDPRVLKVESDEIVAAVKQNNVPVEYLVFDNEGHGFVKKENKIRGYKAILDFLDKYLKTPAPDMSAKE